MYTQIIIFSSIALILLISLQLVFKRALKKRKDKIDDLKSTSPISTSTPLNHPNRTFKSQAKNKVTARFTIIKNVTVTTLLVLFILAIAFPFVDRLPQAYISILVGAAAIITGMAAKPFIENFLAGIAITASKMVNIGDTILINSNYGTIEDISPTHTVVKLWNWKRYVIPNSEMIYSDFLNYSLFDKWIWGHVEFSVAYGTDMDKLEEIALRVTNNSPKYLGVEPPSFWVMKTEEKSVTCWIAAWAASPSDAWELEADIRKNLIMELEAEGIRTHVNYLSSREGVQSLS